MTRRDGHTLGSGGANVTAQIRNPVEWVADQFRAAGHAVDETARRVGGLDATRDSAPPVVRRIQVSDVVEALAEGWNDFVACRTDVVLLALIYPVVGLVLARLVFGYGLLPLLFPLASGFTLLGPVAAVGLYEMSRRRERGDAVSWADAFGVVASPRFGTILVLALLLLALFLAWLVAANAIFAVTLGPEPPASIESFLHDVFATSDGWAMIGAGVGVGFLFALVVLAVSVVSFPLLLDRDVSLAVAVATSARTVIANPAPMAVWGLVVAGSLAVGSIPLFLGFAVAVPVLGHATWHLYRKVVVPQ
jgi:uncharacterized membrane protein